MQARYAQRHTNGKHTQAHTVVAEKALGKSLPPGAEIHHINGDKFDNKPENLVICPSHSYHMLLHRRMEAIAAGYPADYRKCRYCGKYEDPEKLKVYSKVANGYRITTAEHTTCLSVYSAKRYQKNKLKSS